MNTTTNFSHKKLYESVKEAIHTQYVEPLLGQGGPVPADRQLAKEFGVNVGTVAKAMNELALEGLVTRRVGSGTAVIAQAARKLAIGSYFDACIANSQPRLAVYGVLHAALQRELMAQQIESHDYIDVRIPELLGRPLPRLEKDLRQQQVAALLVLRAHPSEYPWLQQLPGPVIGFDLNFGKGAVFLDLRAFAERAVKVLLARGCRSVGLITRVSEGREREAPDYFGMHTAFHDTLADAGLHSQPTWVRQPEVAVAVADREDVEQFGYESFRALWQQPNRPQGLVVHTDVVALGVRRAARELGVVPGRDLTIVAHSNLECRWPELADVPQMAFSMRDVARQLCALAIEAQAGAQPRNVFVKPELLETPGGASREGQA